MGLKDKMMDSMMDDVFSKMSAEEKTKLMETMMDKFMGGLKPEEKQALMSAMMPKIMAGMMGGKGSSPMGMMGMMGGPGGHMKDMMSRMMGGGEAGEGQAPWDMCRRMFDSVGKAADLASFATPEVRGLFEEWAAQIEEEILQFVKESKSADADQIAARFKLSKNSASYFLARLSRQGKISLKAE